MPLAPEQPAPTASPNAAIPSGAHPAHRASTADAVGRDPFVAYLAEHAAAINAYIASYFEGRTDSADIERYLYRPLAEFSGNAGKRHRPLICLLAATAVGGNAEAALSAAAAIEHFQTAALIHDDIADEGELRRGKPCLHRTEGIGIAINCGDLGLVMVTDAVLTDARLDAEVKLRVLRELTDMAIRTMEGQALDLGWVRDGRFDLACEDYLRMATHKTAYYSGAVPLATGAIIGGGTERQIEALRAFGLDTGLAFQIQDDLLNLVGTDEAKEKDYRSDITEGKRTLVAVHALAHTSGSEHDELVSLLRSGTSDEADLSRAVELFERAGSIEYARSHALGLTRRAKERLAGVDLDEDARTILLDMADFFVHRLR